MKSYYSPALILALLLVFTACGKAEERGAKLAQVGSEILYEKDFAAGFSTQDYKTLSSENRKKYIEQWVSLTLLAQEADKEDLDKEYFVIQRTKYAAKKIKGNALIASRIQELKISEDDLFNYYRIHIAEFQKPIMEYKVQRIHVKDYDRALRIKNEINAGLDFGSAVSIFSQENLRNSGGFMGFVSNTGVDSVFWDVAKELERGQAGIVKAYGGWFVIRHYEQRNASEEAGFDLYKDEIRSRILQERRQQIYDDLLLELKQENKEIYYY
jgi:hypothetical protein